MQTIVPCLSKKFRFRKCYAENRVRDISAAWRPSAPRLFLLVKPKRAYFGRKDAQQVAVVKQLVRDLELPVEIVACPIVRDADGLALSSRNIFLSPEERQVALALPRALQAGLAAHRSGADAVRAAREVLDAEPGLRVDYVAEADLDGPTLAAAVVVGSTRVIDNVLLEGEA